MKKRKLQRHIVDKSDEIVDDNVACNLTRLKKLQCSVNVCKNAKFEIGILLDPSEED